LPESRLRMGSCYFLSKRGCILQFRLILYVDFLCEKILTCLDHSDLVRLQTISGEELMAGFLLYDRVERFLSEKGFPSSAIVAGLRQ